MRHRSLSLVGIVLLALLCIQPASSSVAADYPFLHTFSNSTGTPWITGYSYGIAFSASGTAYICSTGGHHVGAYTPAGDRVAWWEATWPVGIAVTSTGSVFVGTQGSSAYDPNHPPTGYYLDVFTPAGARVDRVVMPNQVIGVTVNSSDYVFVTVRTEPAVRIFSKEGAPAGTLGSGLINASAIAVNSMDHVYVLAGSQPGTISVFTRDGTLAGTMATGFPDVGGIAIGEDDTVFATDSTGNRFSVYTSSGSYLGTSSGGNLTNPAAIAVSPSREVFVGDARNIRVQVFSAVPLLTVPGGTGIRGTTTATGTATTSTATAERTSRTSCSISTRCHGSRRTSRWRRSTTTATAGSTSPTSSGSSTIFERRRRAPCFLQHLPEYRCGPAGSARARRAAPAGASGPCPGIVARQSSINPFE